MLVIDLDRNNVVRIGQILITYGGSRGGSPRIGIDAPQHILIENLKVERTSDARIRIERAKTIPTTTPR